MKYARAELLQWVGLLGGATIWTAQLVVGFGATLADCNPASGRFGISLDTWEITLTATAGTLVLLAEAAAVSVLLETRNVEESDPPPWGRRHFFAAGAVVANVLFLAIVLLTGIGAIAHQGCRQA
jgi:hypothetical protein